MPFIAPEQKCDCAKNVTIGTDGGHLNTCHKGNEINNKHDALVKELEHLSNYAGVRTLYEPNNCFPTNNTKSRPDIRLIAPNLTRDCLHDVIVDVSVTFPGADTYLKHKSYEIRGIAAEDREKSKISDYIKFADDDNLHFTPLVFETYGVWGDKLSAFVDSMCKKAWIKRGKCIRLSVIKQYWVKRISCVLQIHNARMFLSRSARLAEGNKSYRQDHSRYADNIRNSVTYVN
jgi:hypothetical protein